MIVSIAVTSDLRFTIHELCKNLGISYAEFNSKGKVKHENTLSSFVPNKLLYVDSMLLALKIFEGVKDSKLHWSILINASELEASEYNLPYLKEVSRASLLNLLTAADDYQSLVRRKDKTAVIPTYLSKIITELYKLPKDQRPAKLIYELVTGKRKRIPTAFPDSLVLAVKQAGPLTAAILAATATTETPSKEEVRRVAKEHIVDIFEINYCLAKVRSYHEQ